MFVSVYECIWEDEAVSRKDEIHYLHSFPFLQEVSVKPVEGNYVIEETLEIPKIV